MHTRLLLFLVAFASLWAMPPGRRRGRGGRRRTEEERLRAWRDRLRNNPGTTHHDWEEFNSAWNDFQVRKARRQIRPHLRRRPELIHSKRRRSSPRPQEVVLPSRGLPVVQIAFGIMVGMLLIVVVAGAAGVQPFSTYTGRFLPFTRAQEPAPHPALGVGVATDTPAPTATPSNPATTLGSMSTQNTGVAVLASIAPTSTPSPIPPTMTPVAPTEIATLVPPTPISTLVSPSLRHIELKRAMLDLVNAERERVGVQPVVLGDNPAAQLHAEQSLTSCTAKHWGVHGTKPYMRYSLTGGYQDSAENAHGSVDCLRPGVNYAPVKPLESVIRAVEGWMNSPGHRKAMLYPTFRKLNVGLAWSGNLFYAFQHFETDHVEFDTLPTITPDGVLHFAGRTKNGAYLMDEDDMFVGVHYDPPLQPLTRGQLLKSGCYASGLRVATLRRPLTDGSRWTTHSTEYEFHPCVDPYDIDPTARVRPKPKPRTVSVPWITASVWDCTRESFEVSADISDVLDKHGNGVYTVRINATVDGEHQWIAGYSIFRGVEAPAVYQGYSGN